MANAPPLPEETAYIWRFFCDLRKGMHPAQRITIDAMQGVEWYHGVTLELWERKLIRALDDLFAAKVAHD